MKPLKNILIGTSLSDESDKIVRTALELAQGSGGAAHVVHACTPPVSFFAAEYQLDSDWTETEKEVLRERLERQIRRTAPAGFQAIQGYLEVGSPHRVLARLARELKPELIVIGAVETRQRLLRPLGSTADRVVRQAACPVLIVRPDSAFPPSRVLAPVDLSEVSAAAFRFGLGLLDQAGVRPVMAELLFVLSPAEASIHFSPDQIAYLARAELQRFAERELPQVRVTRQVRSGMPWEQILLEAREMAADLLILGAQGRSGLERLLLGSVASDVLREAQCSVLVVPRQAAVGEGIPEMSVPESADWSYVSDSVS